MNPVMPSLLFPLCMNAAASYNGNIRIFSNKKVVVNQIIYAAVCNTGRNIHRFVLCIGVNIDFQARRILFGLYSDMFCGMPGRALPILSDVKCASEFTLII